MRARTALVGSLALAWSLSATAQSSQSIPPSELEDKVLGWMKVYNYPIATTPITLDHRVYSPAQLSTARHFANWMQASYLPKGALGDVLQFRNAKLGLYNQNTAALPNSYGAMAKLYFMLRYGANKTIEPMTSDSRNWGLEANGFYGRSVNAVSTAQRTYFTLPTFAQQGTGSELDLAADVARHPVLKQFPTLSVRDTTRGNQRLVVLTKDRRHPFVTVTKGEYLQAVEAAVAKLYADETQKIARDNKGNQSRLDYFMAALNANHGKRLAVLKSNKEKYSARLQEPAQIWMEDPHVMLENYPDVFDGNGDSKRLTVYTIDPKVIELCKTDAPQWIVMYWVASLNDPVSLGLHNAIMNNVDFQYIYDYFFDPAKVKGQPYKPLRSPSFTETVVAGKLSEAAVKNAADPAVVFFEDFSASPVGKKPLNWHSTLDNTGATSVVTELKGLDGHWAAMAGVEIKPTGLKTPLPRDFELSYDVIAAQNYRWGARSLGVKLSRTVGTTASFLSVHIRPGFDGRDGDVEIEGKFPGAPDSLNATKFAKAPGFSNNALHNRVTVTLKKKGDVLQVFVGLIKVAEYEKGVPAGLQFDALLFNLQGPPDDRMFVGNIRIKNNF